MFDLFDALHISKGEPRLGNQLGPVSEPSCSAHGVVRKRGTVIAPMIRHESVETTAAGTCEKHEKERKGLHFNRRDLYVVRPIFFPMRVA